MPWFFVYEAKGVNTLYDTSQRVQNNERGFTLPHSKEVRHILFENAVLTVFSLAIYI